MVYTKRRLKKGPIIILIIFIIIIILVIAGIKLYTHYTSNEYKLEKLGYSEKEINILLKKDDKILKKALTKYDEYLIPLTNQKYFLWKNYKTYKEYINKLQKETNNIDYKKVITNVNTKRNYDFYTHTVKTNMDKGNAILVNKYYSLPEAYAPKDIVNVSNQHSYGTVQIKSEVYDAFKEMFNAAKKENITLIINSGYRDYASQEKVYNQYKETKGEEYADSIAARPDFSEHQTGLALDIITYGASGTTFDTTDAFKWLDKNANKYGFILRYPKNQEDITGYSYESWHFRYIGKNLASKVKQSNLTYDEYYAYYIEE
ncbi:MAG: M15 family metallopeptidase [Bacilli bacterium]|nr:M15 family metallopeptidase [Bacilli bacterium]